MPPALHRRAFLRAAALGVPVVGTANYGHAADGHAADGPAVAWQHRPDHSASFRASLSLEDGGVLLAGETTDRKPLLLTVEPSGTLVDRTVPSLDRDVLPYDVARTSDGGLLLGGRGGDVGAVVKLDTDWRAEWVTSPGREDVDDPPMAVAEFEPGRYAFACFDRETMAHWGHVYALDEAGELLWEGESRVGYRHIMDMAGLWSTEGSAVRFVGTMVDEPGPYYDPLPTVVVDVEADGTRHDVAELDVDDSLAAPAAEGMVTAGEPTDDEGIPDRDRLVLSRHDAGGSVESRTFFGSPEDFDGREVLETPDGGIAVLGTADTPRGDGTDCVLFKAGGENPWTASYVPDGANVSPETAVAVTLERFLVGGYLDDGSRGWVGLLEGGDGATEIPGQTPSSTPTSTPAATRTPTTSPTATRTSMRTESTTPSPTPASVSPETPTGSSPTPGTVGTPGFGVLAGLAGVVGAAAAWKKRND